MIDQLFLLQKNEVVVPKWEKICDRKGMLPGKQMQIDVNNPDNADEFFSALQQHLDQLAAEMPFFITFVCSQPHCRIGTPEKVSPVVRIMRHPSSNSLILLSSAVYYIAGNPFGRMEFEEFKTSIDLIKYVKYSVFCRDASKAVFVCPNREGTCRAEGLDDIDVRGLIQQFPPRDLGEKISLPKVKGGAKMLRLVALSLGMKRILESDAKKISLLKDITGGGLRSNKLESRRIAETLNQLGFICAWKKPLLSSDSGYQSGSVPETLSYQEMAPMDFAHQVVVEALKLIHDNLPLDEPCYIQIQLTPEGGRFSEDSYEDSEEILMLIRGISGFYLVNMKNKVFSTQFTPNIEDVCNYCKVFMLGCSITRACISYFVQREEKKLAE